MPSVKEKILNSGRLASRGAWNTKPASQETGPRERQKSRSLVVQFCACPCPHGHSPASSCPTQAEVKWNVPPNCRVLAHSAEGRLLTAPSLLFLFPENPGFLLLTASPHPPETTTCLEVVNFCSASMATTAEITIRVL